LTIKKRTCYEDVVVNKPIVFRQFDGLQLQEVGDFEVLHCQLSTNFDKGTTLALTAERALLGR
jgi:hypothetical protein